MSNGAFLVFTPINHVTLIGVVVAFAVGTGYIVALTAAAFDAFAGDVGEMLSQLFRGLVVHIEDRQTRLLALLGESVKWLN